MKMIPKHSLREKIYLILVLMVVLGYFINVYTYQQTIKEYTKTYNECIKNLYLEQNGMQDTSKYIINWSDTNGTNR